MTKLSVNINKIATLRNSRGGQLPDVKRAAIRAQEYGAEGITVHPRPDERHIRYQDVRDIKPIVNTELNIEGNPRFASFVALVLEIKPAQVTLVPDAENAITSNQGWNTQTEKEYLKDIISEFKAAGIRTSIFLDPDPVMVYHARETGTDRIELYTEAYAHEFYDSPDKAIMPYIAAAIEAQQMGLGLNAGHDLNLDNLPFFKHNIPGLLEVSIGHALISDAIYLGMEETIRRYRACLR